MHPWLGCLLQILGVLWKELSLLLIKLTLVIISVRINQAEFSSDRVDDRAKRSKQPSMFEQFRKGDKRPTPRNSFVCPPDNHSLGNSSHVS